MIAMIDCSCVVSHRKPCCSCGNSIPAISSGSYYHIAKSIGVGRSHVSRVLRGISGASPELIKLIADQAGVDTGELIEHLRHKKEASK